MIIVTEYGLKNYRADLSKPIDLSIRAGEVKCFHAPDVSATPYVSGDFIGSVKEGAPVNFFNLKINPHGNGTHTECLGHITETQESLGDQLSSYHFVAKVISVKAKQLSDKDLVITKEQIEKKIDKERHDALILRTLPNLQIKLNKDYSDTNPCYLTTEAMEYIVSLNVQHLLLDLPSVDREYDDGKLAAHHIFWGLNERNEKISQRDHCTITELIFVPDEIEDGLYLLNLQVPNISLDAVPSRPVLYKMY